MLTSYDGHHSKCPSSFSNHILKQKHNETIKHLISIVFLFCGLIAWGGEPGGVDLFEAVGRAYLRVALEDACAVLVDVPVYVDAEHLATEVSRLY